MAEPVFTRQVYPHNSYLNPSRDKLASFLRRRNRPKPGHARTLSLGLPCPSQARACCCGGEVREVLAGHSAMLRQIRQFLEAEAEAPAVQLEPAVQVEALQEKARQLEGAVRAKDAKIESLRERYEELLMKFESLSGQSKQSSINTSFDSNTNRSLSVSRREDIVKELRQLKDRLKAINFSQVFRVINQIGNHRE